MGELFKFRNFVHYVQEGYIIDYDGVGEAVDKDGNVIAKIWCDVAWLKKFKKKHPEATHIRWCNR